MLRLLQSPHAPDSDFLRADRGNAVISITAATCVAFLSSSSDTSVANAALHNDSKSQMAVLSG